MARENAAHKTRRTNSANSELPHQFSTGAFGPEKNVTSVSAASALIAIATISVRMREPSSDVPVRRVGRVAAFLATVKPA